MTNKIFLKIVYTYGIYPGDYFFGYNDNVISRVLEDVIDRKWSFNGKFRKRMDDRFGDR